MNRLQLSGAYVSIMLLGLLIFAAAAVLAIDRTQRSTLDSRLETIAAAAQSFLGTSEGRIEIDSDDRGQFLAVLGTYTDGALFDPQGRLLLSSSTNIPHGISAHAGNRRAFSNIGSGDSVIRVFSLPLFSHGRRVGTVVVWRESDWIAESDRNAAVAFGGFAIIIAALALLAGNFVTRRALEDAFARQRRFTADASHELRAPLAVIRAEADLALRKERSVPAYQSAIRTIASEADRMESLIGDLLSAARAESGAAARERIDATELLARVAGRLRSAATAEEAHIHVDGSPGAAIFADRAGLERALLAIGHNAIQHARGRGTIALQARRADRTVEILVADNGPGFSAEALEHALERFWREPGTPAGSGSGLGLAIARSVVEANHGEIRLENTKDGGAVVRLRFPAA